MMGIPGLVKGFLGGSPLVSEKYDVQSNNVCFVVVIA